MSVCPAHSLQKYLPLFDRQQRKVVIDYGAGNLRNSHYLQQRGYQVFAIDLRPGKKLPARPGLTCLRPENLQTLNLSADLAICTFVFNLIAVTERVTVLRRIAGNMVRNGYLLIETKGHSLPELDLLVIPRGFARLHTGRGRYTLIVLYQYLGC